MTTNVLGIDLAGKEDNATGYCCLDTSSGDLNTEIVHKDREIIDKVRGVQPRVIAIDAPFELPESGQYRDSDRKLQSRGYQPLSPVFPGMRVLVKRAQGLIKKLKEEENNYEIIEVFPRASEKILGLERDDNANEDEYDALLCALTARDYLTGNYEDLSGIILPAPAD